MLGLGVGRMCADTRTPAHSHTPALAHTVALALVARTIALALVTHLGCSSAPVLGPSRDAAGDCWPVVDLALDPPFA